MNIFKCLCVTTLICFSGSLAAQDTPVPFYVKKTGGGIENKSKKERISWFTSPIHALRTIPEFRKHIKNGKRNPVKQKLAAYFKKIESHKKVKYAETKKLISFILKRAKKSHKTILGDSVLFTHFLLEQCDVSTFKTSRIVTIKIENLADSNSSNSSNYTKKIIYDNNASRIMSLSVPKTEYDVWDSDWKPLVVKNLLKGFSFEEDSQTLSDLKNELESYGFSLPPSLIREFRKQKSARYSYDLTNTFQFETEADVPKILPIHIQRWKKSPFKYKKGKLVFDERDVKPSRMIEIPLLNNPNKVARFKFVSMILNHSTECEDHQFIYTFPCVIAKIHSKEKWVVYDEERVHAFKDPRKDFVKMLKIPEDSHSRLYDIVKSGAVLYFYQFFDVRKKS